MALMLVRGVSMFYPVRTCVGQPGVLVGEVVTFGCERSELGRTSRRCERLTHAVGQVRFGGGQLRLPRVHVARRTHPCSLGGVLTPPRECVFVWAGLVMLQAEAGHEDLAAPASVIPGDVRPAQVIDLHESVFTELATQRRAVPIDRVHAVAARRITPNGAGGEERHAVVLPSAASRIRFPPTQNQRRGHLARRIRFVRGTS